MSAQVITSSKSHHACSVIMFFLVWPKQWTTAVLLLMLWEHGDEEVGPTTHAVANEVKLLRLSLCSRKCLRIHTCNSDKVWTCLSLQQSLKQRITKDTW